MWYRRVSSRCLGVQRLTDLQLVLAKNPGCPARPAGSSIRWRALTGCLFANLRECKYYLSNQSNGRLTLGRIVAQPAPRAENGQTKCEARRMMFRGGVMAWHREKDEEARAPQFRSQDCACMMILAAPTLLVPSSIETTAHIENEKLTSCCALRYRFLRIVPA